MAAPRGQSLSNREPFRLMLKSTKPSRNAEPGLAKRNEDDDVYERIHSAITRQQLPPGTRLREDEIRQIFGVSRARIRAVFARLAYAGVVTLEPNRGASVTRPSVSEAREIFAARRPIEATIVREAIARMTKRDEMRLSEHIRAEEGAEQQRDRTEMIRLSGDFHILIGEIAGNSVLLKFLRELVVRESLVIAAYETPGRPSCSNHEHSAILAAIAARDADLAVSRMLEHLDAIAERLDLDRSGKPVVDLAAILA